MAGCSSKFIQQFDKLQINCDGGFVTTYDLAYFGYIDPLGVNDSSAALTAAAASGCYVRIPEGVFLMTGTLAFANGTKFDGLGRTCSRIRWPSNATNNAAGFNCTTTASNGSINNMALWYGGTNLTDSAMFSVLGNSWQINSVSTGGISGGNAVTDGPAISVSMDAAIGNNTFFESILWGNLNSVVFTQAATGNIWIACTLSSSNLATNIIDMTNAGLNNMFANNRISSLAAAAYAFRLRTNLQVMIGNDYIAVLGAVNPAVPVSTELMANSIGTVNTSVDYSVDGVRVVTNQRPGWAAIGGYTFTPSRGALNSGTVTLAQLADQFITLLNDLGATNGHGLTTN